VSFLLNTTSSISVKRIRGAYKVYSYTDQALYEKVSVTSV